MSDYSKNSKPVLFQFVGSVWAAAPVFALEHVGSADEYQIEDVNVINAENLTEKYLNITKSGTIPALITKDSGILTNTFDTVNYILKKANYDDNLIPKKVTPFLEKLHGNETNPNFQFFSAIDENELNQKRQSYPSQFIKNHIAYIQENQSTTTEDIKKIYQGRLNFFKDLGLDTIYNEQTTDENIKAQFYQASKQGWLRISDFLSDQVSASFSQSSPWVSKANQPGAEDFHFAVWLSRLVHLAGGDATPQGLDTLQQRLGEKKISKSVESYWNALIALQSFQNVYKRGYLH